MDEGQRFALAARWGLDPEDLALLLEDPALDGVAEPPPPRQLEPLGQGGMAEVWLARDERLDRLVAMKILRPALAGDVVLRDRFLREARATARLAHPGIVPVHDVGVLPDGRPWFTMDIVRGATLDTAAPGRQGAALHRTIDLFRRAVEAVAYAHDQGVVHRDLKPSNLMVGPFGSVFVLDWGLIGGVGGGLDDGGPGLTRDGTIQGTPGYLAPEQARGEPATAASDVFALGLVLWELLAGRPAFDPALPVEAIGGAACGRIPRCTEGPEALRTIVARATRPEPSDRYPDGASLADALGRWLDGEARRLQADLRVAEARALAEREATLVEEADRLHALAVTALAGVEGYAGVDTKREGWALQDRRDALRAEAHVVRLRRLQSLHGALTHDADHAEALAALSDHWLTLHVAAEAVRDEAAAREALTQLAHHDRGARASYLRGDGRITVRTEPPGAVAVLYRYEERGRRVVAVDPRTLGPTPTSVEVPMGSWLVRFEGHDAVLPVWVRRGEDCRPEPVPLLAPGALGPDDCHVPGGVFWSGSPTDAFQARPWAESRIADVIVRRHPVTNREYLVFLDALVAGGREVEALRFAPHERGAPDRPGAQIYGRTPAGGFCLVPDADGDTWDLDWPVFLIDHGSALAYAAWLADRTGLPWRLPTELEWEKAARGVDGRTYPWGDRFDASFCCIRASHQGRPLPVSVHAFPADVSPYGVRGMAGNVRDWCQDPYEAPGEARGAGDPRVLKGGCWYFPEGGARLAARYALDAHNRGDTVSFRVVRDVVSRDLLR